MVRPPPREPSGEGGVSVCYSIQGTGLVAAGAAVLHAQAAVKRCSRRLATDCTLLIIITPGRKRGRAVLPPRVRASACAPCVGGCLERRLRQALHLRVDEYSGASAPPKHPREGPERRARRERRASSPIALIGESVSRRGGQHARALVPAAVCSLGQGGQRCGKLASQFVSLTELRCRLGRARTTGPTSEADERAPSRALPATMGCLVNRARFPPSL